MKFWQFLLSAAIGWTLAFAVIIGIDALKEEPQVTIEVPEAKVHDVCRWGVGGKAQCYTVPFYDGLYTVKDGQVWAMGLDGYLFYSDEVVYVGRCTENCEVKK